MSLLLLDIGNSRAKWARLGARYRRGVRFDAQGALALGDAIRDWQPLMATQPEPTRLYVCNVAGEEVTRQLRRAASAWGLPKPHFAATARQAGGVRNGYREPWRLGVDRWLALIGARHEHPGVPVCIVSVGTALTIDLMSAAGVHLGGSITPGPRLMIDSLLSGTAGIRRRAGATRALRAQPPPHTPFARDTRGGLLAGASYAAAGLIERALREASTRLAQRPRLLLSGGGADAVQPLLTLRCWRQDDLVLRGLAILAG
jgi:type III pantothenate kinase